MFTQLLASKPVKQRSTMGLVTSVVFHLSIAAGVIYATAHVARADDRPPEDRITFHETEPDLPPATQPSMPTTPMVGGFAGPVISVPIDIPTSLPPIDISAPATPTDFPKGARFVPGGTSSAGGTGFAPAPGAAYFAEQVDVVVTIGKGSPMPKYPSALRPLGIDGSARFRFVVDTLGRVEMASVEQVQSTHDAFAMTVRSTLPQMRFTPAQVNGKYVRQLVELPFVFRVER